MQKKIDITGRILYTERMILRPFEEKDLEDLYEYASVPGVGECAGWHHHENMETSRMILQMFMEGRHTFALTDRETGKAMGSLGLETPSHYAAEEDRETFGCEIGYVLGKPFWGRGLMTEAVKEAIRFCLQELHMDWITCAHFMENDRSRRVIEKCGFTYVRDVRYETQMGEYKPTRLYVIRK